MTDTGWEGADPVKAVGDYAKRVKAIAAKLVKLHEEARALVASKPVGELLKCRNVAALAKLQIALQDADESAKNVKGPLYNGYEAVRKSVLPVVMEDLELTNTKVAGVGRVELRPDMFVSAIKNAHVLSPPLDEAGQPIIGPLNDEGEPTREDWEAIDAHDWLGRIGSADLISETVNSSSLKALIKKRSKDGKDVPTELFNISPFTYAAIVKK